MRDTVWQLAYPHAHAQCTLAASMFSARVVRTWMLIPGAEVPEVREMGANPRPAPTLHNP